MRKLQSTYINPCVVNVLHLCCVVEKPNAFKRKLKKQKNPKPLIYKDLGG